MTNTSNQAVTYVPFGSFQRPSTTNVVNTDIQLNTDLQLRGQSQEKIRDEVTSSFDVKPLNPRPTFPRQAQVVPMASDGTYREITHPVLSNNSMYNQKYAAEIIAKQKQRNSLGDGDENFVYIHRHNSFIDVSKMTHCDHSNPPSPSSNVSHPRCSSRSHDEVDAAMTLATGLQS